MIWRTYKTVVRREETPVIPQTTSVGRQFAPTVRSNGVRLGLLADPVVLSGLIFLQSTHAVSV